jgi:hypothetical protein
MFLFDDLEFKTVIECSAKCTRLVLFNCQIVITENFNIDPNIDYQIEGMDLRLTMMSKNGELRLNKRNMDIFFKALSKTNMKDSLEYIQIYFSENDLDFLTRIRTRYGFTNTKFVNSGLYGGGSI